MSNEYTFLIIGNPLYISLTLLGIHQLLPNVSLDQNYFILSVSDLTVGLSNRP